MDSLVLQWLDSPVDVDPAIQLEGGTLNDISLRDCSQNYTSGGRGGRGERKREGRAESQSEGGKGGEERGREREGGKEGKGGGRCELGRQVRTPERFNLMGDTH